MAGVDDVTDERARNMWNRRLWSRFVLMYLGMAASAVIYLSQRPSVWEAVPVLLVAVVTAVLGMRTTFQLDVPLVERLPYEPSFAALLVLCLALPAFVSPAWSFNASWASAAVGWRGGRWLVPGLAAIGVALGLLTWWHGMEPLLVLWISLMSVVVGFFTSQARGQLGMFAELQASRRALALFAVVEERDRIARDLHDLVGHSLSVIAVKNELARRLVTTDPDRAGSELADIDTVVRRALAEVRQAVTNYRQPTLAGELASARKVAASAGIDCRVDSPDTWHLPVSVDGVLAWSVREGVTNVLRHSQAANCRIRLSITDKPRGVELWISDDGVGPGPGPDPGLDDRGRGRGNGLLGLGERVQALGGSVESGPGPDGGFVVHVRVPA